MNATALLTLPLQGDAECGIVIEDLDAVGTDAVAMLTFCLRQAELPVHTARTAGLAA
ncbi:hypothetical protein [Streptomyces sp. NBC_00503]|uniref:hypothetical protein n=1 Tax=Streptomyces sp. NBC_00503 TaxID=2903659 RepID=UPI002E805BB4|nr:hypothetical protein [Streptomyces sp. NBC_00503]WUD82561.1 hypothetical protein OG490_19550 [Streptomyces sp. NBC_00503]